MEQVNSLSNKKIFIRGLRVSLVTFLSCWLSIYLFRLFADVFFNGLGLEGSGLTTFKILHPLLYAMVTSIPFLFLNSLFYFLSKEVSFKKGLKCGYLFILIPFAMGFFSYIRFNQSQSSFNRMNETVKLMNAGDVSVCDTKIVNQVFADLGSSTKTMKGKCYQAVADWAVKTGVASNCDRLANNPPSFNSCILGVSQTNKDPNVCNKLNSEPLIENCYLLAIKESQNKALIGKYCALVKTETYRQQCDLLLR